MNTATKTPTYRAFENRYTYDTTVKSDHISDIDGGLETLGDDVEQVKEILAKTPRRVWTMVDAEGTLHLLAGCRYVNRLYYVITKEEWSSENECYKF